MRIASFRCCCFVQPMLPSRALAQRLTLELLSDVEGWKTDNGSRCSRGTMVSVWSDALSRARPGAAVRAGRAAVHWRARNQHGSR